MVDHADIDHSGITGAGSAFNTARLKYTGGDFTTTSGTLAAVDTTNARLSLTTGANRVLVGVSGSMGINSTGEWYFGLRLDGTEEGGTDGIFTGQSTSGSNNLKGLSFTWLTATLSAGAHTFDLSYKSSGGNTLTVSANSGRPLHMWAIELPL